MNTTLERLQTDRRPSDFDAALPSVAVRPQHRRTRIVGTLGPASASREVLLRLVAAGLDVARFNCSHGTPESHKRLAETVRGVAAELDREVTLMQDLQGPKLRIGSLLSGSIDLIDGQDVVLTAGARSDSPSNIAVPHADIVRSLQPLDRVMLGDGEIELSVQSARGGAAVCTVVHGGHLTDGKGITVPGRCFSKPIVTDKDLRDIAMGKEIGFDMLAISFVRSAADVDSVRRLTRRMGWKVALVAKLETREALDDLDGILAASDAVMVARGDLGLQLPIAEVPVAQKTIIERANRAPIPVITATQMLESMVTNSRPTRAEACDVANAVWDGTDAVMLSAETASGRFPVEAVRVMSQLCVAAESNNVWRRSVGVGWPVRSARGRALVEA